MKKPLFLLMLILTFGITEAQQLVMGTVTTEFETEVPGVTIMNMRTEEQTQTNGDGHYVIKAAVGDELRFVKRNFERVAFKVKAEDFSKPLNISIQLKPQDIEEVEIAFKPTGILKKDVRALDRPRKVVELNNALANSMRIPPATAYPTNKMPSTLSFGPNFNAGQMSLFSTGGGGLIGAVVGSIIKKTQPAKTTPDYSETLAFYKRVKENVDLQYFYNRGLDEYQFEMLLAFTDGKYNLAKNFKSNFNKIAIENYLKNELKDFMDRHKTQSVQEPT